MRDFGFDYARWSRGREVSPPAKPMPQSAQLCIRALLEWEKGKVFSDENPAHASGKRAARGLDRAFLMETFFGVLRI